MAGRAGAEQLGRLGELVATATRRLDDCLPQLSARQVQAIENNQQGIANRGYIYTHIYTYMYIYINVRNMYIYILENDSATFLRNQMIIM